MSFCACVHSFCSVIQAQFVSSSWPTIVVISHSLYVLVKYKKQLRHNPERLSYVIFGWKVISFRQQPKKDKMIQGIIPTRLTGSLDGITKSALTGCIRANGMLLFDAYPSSRSKSSIILLEPSSNIFPATRISGYDNKDRFCNTIETVALIGTSIQSDYLLQTRKVLATSKSKQIRPQKLPRNQ